MTKSANPPAAKLRVHALTKGLYAMIVPCGAGAVNTPRVLPVVARVYNDRYNPEIAVTPDAILGPSRVADVAQARHVCVYVLMEDYGLTCTAASTALGRRDHSTSINSRTRIAAALPRDTRLAQLIERVRAELAGRTEARARHWERRRRDAFAGARPRELAEYRYWRLRSLRMGAAW